MIFSGFLDLFRTDNTQIEEQEEDEEVEEEDEELIVDPETTEAELDIEENAEICDLCGRVFTGDNAGRKLGGHKGVHYQG